MNAYNATVSINTIFEPSKTPTGYDVQPFIAVQENGQRIVFVVLGVQMQCLKELKRGDRVNVSFTITQASHSNANNLIVERITTLS